ncbi:MAG: PilN domain-containing protein [Polyangiaceae bacterium]
MIRVNLLPGSKKELGRAAAGAGTAGQSWLLFVLGGLLLEVLALVFAWTVKSRELSKVRGTNQGIQANIDLIDTQIKDHPEIKARLRQLKDRESAIDKLQAARTGPTEAVMELSHILSVDRGPTTDPKKIEKLRRENPAALPQSSWDPHRLWVLQYQEKDRDVTITGLARDGEDVSEFLRRLTVSEYFYDLSLLPGGKTTDPLTKLDVIKFQINAKTRY